jgi:hypothetical protein
VFKYLLTRLVFKLTDKKGIDLLRKSVPNLEGLSAQQVANLSLGEGECVVETDDDCTDPVLKVPQLMRVRPRCSQHGGAAVRNTPPGEG